MRPSVVSIVENELPLFVHSETVNTLIDGKTCDAGCEVQPGDFEIEIQQKKLENEIRTEIGDQSILEIETETESREVEIETLHETKHEHDKLNVGCNTHNSNLQHTDCDKTNTKAKLICKTRHVSEYRGQLNAKAIPNKGMYILTTYQNEDVEIPVKILIDSGSSMSLYSRSAYEKIPEFARPPVKYTNKRIKFADGSCQDSSGIVTFDFQIGDKIEQVDFLLGDYTDEAILGMADITKLSLSIDFSNLLVTQGENWLPIHDVQQCLIGRKVLVRKTVVIPAQSQMVLPAYVENLDCQFAFHDSPVMLETNTKLTSKSGIIPIESLHQEIDESIPVMVFNTSERSVKITGDTILGKFTDVGDITNIQEEIENIRYLDCVREVNIDTMRPIMISLVHHVNILKYLNILI